MEKAKNTWGGARNYPKGTGLRVILTCRIDPETMARIVQLSKDVGISKGKVIDLLVKDYFGRCDEKG